MKKINTAVYIILLVLALFSCNRKNSIKDYIEKGFAKPSIEGSAESESYKEGYNKKLYVPSEENIEVELTIKNKYEQELTCSIDLSEEQKRFFSVPPFIKELTPKKLVMGFNFKEEADASLTNNFLGESVNVKINVCEKKTGRNISNYQLTLNCNTAPLPLVPEKITYKEESDKYEIVLPKNEGKHKDLHKVIFILSSKFGEETAEPIEVAIDDENIQGGVYTVNVKKSEGGSLLTPSGQRQIKVIVYDKAGIKSRETSQETRIFTSITLIPSETSASIGTAEEDGIEVPKIKELEKFFNGNDWETKAGYRITYKLPQGFRYDNTKNKFIKEDKTLPIGKYNVEVILQQGQDGNEVKKIYPVTIDAGNEVRISKENLVIEDISPYESLLPPNGATPLVFAPEELEFTGQDVKEATVPVKFTSFVTDLKVIIKAMSSKAVVKDENGMGDADQKEFTPLHLAKDKENKVTLKFSILAEDRQTEQKYKISFVRQAPVKITLRLDCELLSQGGGNAPNGQLNITWTYGNVTLNTDVTGNRKENIMYVAKGDDVDLSLMPGEGARVVSCSSSDNSHANSIRISDDSALATLKADRDFQIEALLRADATIKWDRYKDNEDVYTKGKIIAKLNEVEIDAEPTEDAIACSKGSDVHLKILDLKKKTFKVSKWVVDGVDVKTSSSKYVLNEDKTEIIIKNIAGDVIAYVETETQTYDISWPADTNKCLFKVKVENSYITTNPYTAEYGMSISIEAHINEDYEIDYWLLDETKYKLGSTQPTDPAKIESIQKGEKLILTVSKNHNVDIKLKRKQHFNVSWYQEGGGSIEVKNNGSQLSGNSTSAIIGQNLEFTAIPLTSESWILKEWQVDNTTYKLGSTLPSGITIEDAGNGMQKLTLTVSREHVVKVVFTKSSHTVEWSITGEDNLGILNVKKVGDSELLNSSPYQANNGVSMEFEAIPGGFNVLKEWIIDGHTYTADTQPTSLPEGVTIKKMPNTNTQILRIDNIEKSYNVQVSFEKTYSLSFSIVRRDVSDRNSAVPIPNGAYRILFEDINKGESLGGSVQSSFVRRGIRAGTMVRIEIEGNNTNYESSEWEKKKTNDTLWNPVSGTNTTETTCTITMNSDMSVRLFKKEIVPLSVALTLPDDENEAHSYTIKASAKGSDASNVEAIAGTTGQYRVAYGTTVLFKVELEEGVMASKYNIKEWKIKSGAAGGWSNFSTNAGTNNKEAEKKITELTNVKIQLEGKYIYFKIEGGDEVVEDTEISVIYDNSDVYVANKENEKYLVTGRFTYKLEINLSSIPNDSVVIGWKKNGVLLDEHKLPNGFWQTTISSIELDVGDTVTLLLTNDSALKYISFKIMEGAEKGQIGSPELRIYEKLPAGGAVPKGVATKDKEEKIIVEDANERAYKLETKMLNSDSRIIGWKKNGVLLSNQDYVNSEGEWNKVINNIRLKANDTVELLIARVYPLTLNVAGYSGDYTIQITRTQDNDEEHVMIPRDTNNSHTISKADSEDRRTVYVTHNTKISIRLAPADHNAKFLRWVYNKDNKAVPDEKWNKRVHSETWNNSEGMLLVSDYEYAKDIMANNGIHAKINAKFRTSTVEYKKIGLQIKKHNTSTSISEGLVKIQLLILKNGYEEVYETLGTKFMNVNILLPKNSKFKLKLIEVKEGSGWEFHGWQLSPSSTLTVTETNWLSLDEDQTITAQFKRQP